MDRKKAYKLTDELVDAGFSVLLNVGVHKDMTPKESCVVKVSGLRFTGADLLKISDLVDEYDCDLHFISGDGMTVVERPRRAT